MDDYFLEKSLSTRNSPQGKRKASISKHSRRTSATANPSNGSSAFPTWISETFMQFTAADGGGGDSSTGWTEDGEDSDYFPSISDSPSRHLNRKNESPVKNDDGERMNGLIQHAKQVATQLQNLVEKPEASYDLVVDGKQPTYDELVGRLGGILEYQRSVNHASAKMTSANYVVNMVNIVRNKQLRDLVQKGKYQLQEMQANVMELETHVEDLNTEVSVQKKCAERLKGNLDATRSLLESTITEYRVEMARQRGLLEKQRAIMSSLFRSKFNQDFILDSSIFAGALYAANTMLVDYPISFVVMLVGRNGRNRKQALFVRQFLKLACLVYFVREMRKFAFHYGLHNKTGGYAGYAWMGMTSAASAIRKLLTAARNNVSTTNPTLPVQKPLETSAKTIDI